MSYTRLVVQFSVADGLAYIGNVSIGGGDYEFNYAISTTITNQTEYDAVGWFTDMRSKPSWSDVVTAFPLAVSYYNIVPTDSQSLENVQEYLGGEYETRMAAAETVISGLGSAATHDASDFVTSSAITTAVNAAVASLVNSAPGTLDTLGEIATALQSDESTAAALATTVGGKISLSSTVTGLSTSDASSVTATDTILAAIGKLQAQLTATQAKFTRTTSSLSLSLVGTGATGTQISSTKDSTIHLNISDSTTSTIGGAAISNVDIKMCATNDSTEANWTTLASIDNEQTITLAIVLQSIQVVKGAITADIPAGYFVKCVNTGSGTHTETYISGQKTIYG